MNGWPASAELAAILRLKSPNSATIEALMQRFAKAMPDAKCELYYETPYQLLVSVVLSAQATDKSVNLAMTPLHQKGLRPETVVEMGEAGFLKHIKSIGLAPTKARNVLKLSQILLEKYQGEIPRTREELEALPGVGRKTANVILGEIYGEPTLAVDTHVFRVGQRLGLHKEPSPEKAEQRLLKVIPRKYLPKAHHWLILHGRYHCTARKPDCKSCIVTDLCPSSGKIAPANDDSTQKKTLKTKTKAPEDSPKGRRRFVAKPRKVRLKASR